MPDYCTDAVCPGYGTLKSTHAHEPKKVDRRSDGGSFQSPKDGTTKEHGPNKRDDDDNTAPRVTRHG